MEPVIAPSTGQLTLAASEQAEDGIRTNDTAEQSGESFVATIVRLDQSAAEQLFRAAKL
jgi:hypothetical protein